MDWKDRFLSKLRWGPNCWEWAGAHDIAGYGRFQAKYRTVPRELRAHRIAYELFVGPIPSGFTIDHLCRNKGCVNPTHLEPVSPRENVLRGNTLPAENIKKRYCPQGHEYNRENTHLRANNKRECRTCMRLRRRRQLAQKRLESSNSEF